MAAPFPQEPDHARTWHSLEQIPGNSAVPFVWSRRLGPAFDGFGQVFFYRKTEYLARSHPCTRGCGCWHDVTGQEDGHYIAACTCESKDCPDLRLTRDDLTPLALDVHRLGRAIAVALNCTPHITLLPAPGTVQIGSWSADGVPVILTIQLEPSHLRHAVAELVARLNTRFILLAPTARNRDAATDELLARVGAAFFPLEGTLAITNSGTLVARITPGALFEKFTPQAGDADQETASRVVALATQFDAKTLKVFRWYCVECLSATDAAARCKLSKTGVMRRLKKIQEATGVTPAELRRLSPHFGKIEEAGGDSRAKRIRPSAMIEQEQEEGGA